MRKLNWHLLLILFFSFTIGLFAQSETPQTAQYEAVFKEFLSLTRAAAEGKDAETLLTITDNFEKEHHSLHLARVYIWNKDMGTQTNLLFRKEYRKGGSEETIHYRDESKINVAFASEAVMVDFRPRQNRISYRLVFLR